MINVLHLTSWDIGRRKRLQVPFLFEQINLIGSFTRSTVINPAHIHFRKWLWKFLTGSLVHRDYKLWGFEDNTKQFVCYLPNLPFGVLGKTYLDVLDNTSKKLLGWILRQHQIKPDIIHCHVVLNQGIVAYNLSRYFNIPYVVHEHSCPLDMHLDTEHKREFTQLIFTGAKSVFAVGEALQSEIEQKFEVNNVNVIPNPIGEGIFWYEKKLLSSKVRLVSVGSLIERKDHSTLIAAVSRLVNNGIDAHITIVGEGIKRDSLIETAAVLNISDRLTILPWMNKKELNDLLHNHHVYVHSSLHETFGLAPLEAMICGLPAVVTQCGGPEQYVNENNGVVVEPGNETALAQGIQDVIRNYETYNMAVESAKLQKIYSTDTFTKSIEQVYLDTIGK